MYDYRDEAAAYHALALRAEGDIHALELLFKEYGGFTAAYRALQEQGIPLPDTEAEWNALRAQGIGLALRDDPSFPALLREAPDAPFALYVKVKGTFPAADLRLAIVGTRSATAYGRKIAADFAETLGRAGAVIVSGLAYGIDASAHEGALKGNAPTIAVMPCGLDCVYPSAHTKLAERIIASGGALVGEYPPGAESFPSRFLERNRIVSGLARGVIIIEAPARSGALVTARLALEQNREVFVVPGKPNEPQYEGSHALVRAGARLVSRPEDVVEDLGITLEPADRREKPTLSEMEERVLSCLKAKGPLSVDKLIEESELEPPAIIQALALLALKDLVIESGVNFYAK